MTDADTDWETVGFVGASKYREAVLTELEANGAATPSQLRDATDHSIASISHALGALRDRGLVDLLVAEDRRKGRYYGATDAGEAVAEKVRRETA